MFDKKSTRAINTDEHGLTGFLQQCIMFDLSDAVIAILDRRADSLYENEAYRELNAALLITEHYPELRTEAFVIEDLCARIIECLDSAKPLSFSAHCYYSPKINVQLTFLLRPIHDTSADTTPAVMLTIADENIRQKACEELEPRVQQRTAELNKNKTYLQTVVDTILDAVVTIDEQGAIETFNPTAEKMFGYTADEVIGRNVNMLMPQYYRDRHHNYIENYLRTGAAQIIGFGREVQGQCKDDSIFSLDLAVNEMRANGKRKFVGIMRDITKSKQDELKRAQQANLIEALYKAQSMFMGSASNQSMFDYLLRKLLELSESEYGFIGEVLKSG